MIVTELGREIKRLRAERGITVRQLASLLDKSAAYVAKIEVGGEIPSPMLIGEISKALDVDAACLLGLARESLLVSYGQKVGREYAPLGTEKTEQKSPWGPGGRVAKVVSFINMKGGVGKTTLAMQVAHAADAAGFKVLAVDLDPQSNLSQALMGPKRYVEHLRAHKPTVVQIFDEYVPPAPQDGAPRRLDIKEVVVKRAGYWQRTTLDLIPSRLELSRTLKNPTGKERRLAKALSRIAEDYDLIIIDCAPTESILTDAAYFASRYVIAPIKPEFMATIGLPLLARSIKEFQLENDDHEISIAGLVFDHSSAYTSGPEGQQSIKEVSDIAKAEGWYICRNQVRYSASYAKSAREGRPLGHTSYARSDVVAGLRQLTDEIFDIIGLVKPSAKASA